MSQPIDRPGTFRGKPLEWGVSESRNGFPQFVVTLSALEYYNEEVGEYVPWAEYQQEITGYFILYTLDKTNGQWVELLNAKQIKEALGWDGKTFESLAEGQYGETIILFRVEDNEYNGQHSLKVTWIDKADVNPVKTLPKYDTTKLKALTAKLGGVLRSATSAPTPAKAPAKAPARSTTPASTPTSSPVPSSAPASPAVSPVSSVPSKRGPGRPPKVTSAPTAPTPPAKPVDENTPAEVPTELTKAQAWTLVYGVKTADVTDEKLAEVWIAEATKIGKDEKDFTPTDWAAVADAVRKQVDGIPY